jgi:ectoine hydroxylase-related dioxygenase (phytanoyl-CoA dioxygenase family)
MGRTDPASVAKQFREDGVVFLEKALDTASMRMAEEAYNWSLQHPSPAATTFPQSSSAVFYQDLANPAALPAYRRLLEESSAADIAASLWGAPDVWFMYEQVFLKQGGKNRRTPWHQDSSYLPVDGDELAVIWISFEPVARENSLELVRGSHRGIMYNGSRFDPADDTAPLYPDGNLPRLPNIEAERDKWDIVSWAVEPGDVLVFHPGMLHGGAPTHPGQRRRTLSLRFFGDDAVYALRPTGFEMSSRSIREEPDDVPRSVFTKLPNSLSPGDPFRHPGFPKLRPRSCTARQTI